jgi:hypothetical protein
VTVKMMHPGSAQEIEVLEGSERRYIANGWRRVEADAPKGNASLKAWQDYARSKGLTDFEGMTRDELRAALG